MMKQILIAISTLLIANTCLLADDATINMPCVGDETWDWNDPEITELAIKIANSCKYHNRGGRIIKDPLTVHQVYRFAVSHDRNFQLNLSKASMVKIADSTKAAAFNVRQIVFVLDELHWRPKAAFLIEENGMIAYAAQPDLKLALEFGKRAKAYVAKRKSN